MASPSCSGGPWVTASRVRVRSEVYSPGGTLGVLVGGMTDVAGRATCGPWECAFCWHMFCLQSIWQCWVFCGTLISPPWPKQRWDLPKHRAAFCGGSGKTWNKKEHKMQMRRNSNDSKFEKIFNLTRNPWNAMTTKISCFAYETEKNYCNRKLPVGAEKTLSFIVGSSINLYLMRHKNQQPKVNPFGGWLNILSCSLRKISEMSPKI